MSIKKFEAFSGFLLLFAGFIFIQNCSCEGGAGFTSSNGRIKVYPNPVNIGPTTVSTTDFAKVTVENIGTGKLTVKNYYLKKNNPDFSLSGPSQGGQFDIETSGGTQELVIYYTPSDTEKDEDTLVIESDDPDNPVVEVPVCGNCKVPEIEVCYQNGQEGGCNQDQTDLKVDLGPVEINSQKKITVTIKSVGESDIPLNITGVDFEYRSSDEFTMSPSDIEPMSLAPSEEYSFDVIFAPTDGRPENAKVRIGSNDINENPVIVEISGQGDAAATCVDPMVMDFGEVEIGTSKSMSFTITSCGTRPIDLNSLELVSDTGEFTWDGAAPTVPVTLQPGGTITGDIKYTPTVPDAVTGKVTLSTTDIPNGWITLKGTGKMPPACDLDVQPRLINFGEVAPGYYSEKEIYVVNAGEEACTNVNFAPPTNSAFSITPSSLSTVAPGQSYILKARFNPPGTCTQGTILQATATVSSNDPLEPTFDVQLVGRCGDVARCEFTVDPPFNGSNPFSTVQIDGKIDFGLVGVGSSKRLPIKFTNVGTGPCRINSATYQPPSGFLSQCPTGNLFSVVSVPSPNIDIPPGSTAEVMVEFHPDQVIDNLEAPPIGTCLNPHLLVVDTTDNTPNPPHNPPKFYVMLTGKAQRGDIEVIPTELDFGLITVNCSSPEECVRVYNAGGMDLTLTGISVEQSPPFYISRAPRTPYVIPPQQHTEICVTFEPDSDQSYTGWLKINSDDNDEPQIAVKLSGEGTYTTHQVDHFTQLTEPKVDNLWVIDNSGSMQEEQDSLRNNFNHFIQAAISLNVDYHIGVITTEVNDPNEAGILQGNPKYITRTNVSDPVAAFQNNADVGTCCSDEQEAGLEAAKMALSPPIIDDPQKNQGFLRDDARLSIICVSDEEDQSDGPVDMYVDFFRSIHGYRNTEMIQLSAICGDSPGGCSGRGGQADAGERYIDAQQQLGGVFMSICESDWASGLSNLGWDTFVLRTEFPLSREPVQSSIEVRVNGQSVANSASCGWQYDPQYNTVYFTGSCVPDRGSDIEIEYDVLCR